MTESGTPETFVVGEWVMFHESDYNRKVQVTAVDGDEVTARVHGKPMRFSPRGDGRKLVKVDSPDSEPNPPMIVRLPPVPPRTKSRWKDVRDFIWGMFWAP